MAFLQPLPNKLSFTNLPESIWNCCECQSTNTVFDHPTHCSACNVAKCSKCIDGNRASNSWQSRTFSREMARYNAFPPRVNKLGEPDESGKVGNYLTRSPPQPSSPIRPQVPKVSEKILEQIADITPQAVRIDVDRVTRDSPDVDVLRGYRPNEQSDLTPVQYYEYLDRYYKLPQFPHNGLYDGQKIHYAFIPEDLDAKGALFKENILPNNLNNPIHEFFNINHWINTEDSIYKVLEPALHLASMFLQQPVTFQVGCTQVKRVLVCSRYVVVVVYHDVRRSAH